MLYWTGNYPTCPLYHLGRAPGATGVAQPWVIVIPRDPARWQRQTTAGCMPFPQKHVKNATPRAVLPHGVRIRARPGICKGFAADDRSLRCSHGRLQTEGGGGCGGGCDPPMVSRTRIHGVPELHGCRWSATVIHGMRVSRHGSRWPRGMHMEFQNSVDPATECHGLP